MRNGIQHVFLVGAKSLGAYGGYETFINKLTEYHRNNFEIKYHVACKANGDGCMDETKLEGVTSISENEFEYHNAHCFKIPLPNVGSGQAIIYDTKALDYCCKYIKDHNIENPIVYIMACRIGPWISKYYKKIHKLGGRIFLNPDGHEWKRAKWPAPIRRYWKKGLSAKSYYLVVGRFVPENNYETMIKEFMKSKSKRDFAIITNVNSKFLEELEEKLHFRKDPRIKFVGTVYDQELLMKIRENAYGYFHGHEVGGTNPSLLEALGSTDLNLLLNVGFNKEVAEDAAVYWTKQSGYLAKIIERADAFDEATIAEYGRKAKQRIKEAYSWQYIADKYQDLWKRW